MSSSHVLLLCCSRPDKFGAAAFVSASFCRSSSFSISFRRASSSRLHMLPAKTVVDSKGGKQNEVISIRGGEEQFMDQGIMCFTYVDVEGGARL
eukprot:5553337-Amphidinium_carterae.1